MNKKSLNTKKAITNSLLSLLSTNNLEEITVLAICNHANVSRRAFYNHYNKIEDVIKDAYRFYHNKHFGNKYKNLSYLYSDEFIWDNIHFAMECKEILIAMQKWNLTSYIATYDTSRVQKYINQYDDKVIKYYNQYYNYYTGIRYFNLCSFWVMNGQKESPQEMFDMFKYFNGLERNIML